MMVMMLFNDDGYHGDNIENVFLRIFQEDYKITRGCTPSALFS